MVADIYFQTGSIQYDSINELGAIDMVHCAYYGTIYVTEYNIWYYEDRIYQLPINLTPMIRVRKIESKNNHFWILLTDGKLYGFRGNIEGQLGTIDLEYDRKSLEDKLKSPFIYSGVIDVYSGYYFSLLCLENGQVFGMGNSNSYQLGLNKEVVDFQKIHLPCKPIKYAVSSHTIMLLDSEGIVYATGTSYGCRKLRILAGEYKGFRPLEPFYSQGLKVKDIWHSSTASFIQLFNGSVYIGGYIDGDYFGINSRDNEYFTFSDYLTRLNIKAIMGYYNLIVVTPNQIHISGRDRNKALLKPKIDPKLTELLNMGYEISVSFKSICMYRSTLKSYDYRKKLLLNSMTDIILRCLS